MVQRLTKPTVSVLSLLLEAGDNGCYGLEIIDQAGIGPGTVYPMLTRLESLKWVESNWEDVEPTAVGRPARRYYKLTALGRIEAQKKLESRNAERLQRFSDA